MAAVPNFGDLANQQKAANDSAANQTNIANRPNQYNPLGNTTWGLNPDGTWGQSTTLSGGAQGLWDQSMQGQQNLSGQISGGLNTSGLMGWGNSDLNGNLGEMPKVGQYNQEVINAWNALQNPGLQKSEDAARQRAAAMGITMGSNAWGDQERSLGNVRTDAGNKAILAGYSQGNTEFGQALDARKQGYTENLGEATLQNSMRGQELGERKDAYGAAISGNTSLTNTRNSLNPNEWNAKAPTSANYLPTQIYSAAGDTFSANQANENAAQAQSNANRSANTGLLNTALNTAGQIGWGNIGSAAGSIWNWGKDAYNGWGNTQNGYSTVDNWDTSPYSGYNDYSGPTYTTGG
jgi:hypothetical protein